MSSVETNYIDTCHSAADVMAQALTVRDRRRSLFFVPQPPRIAKPVQPAKAEKPIFVPTNPGLPCAASFLFVPSMTAPVTGGEATMYAPGPFYRIGEIGRAMCLASGVLKNEMFSPRRESRVAHARQLAMLLCKILTDRSLPEIGRRFAGRDHTTVLHAIRKYEWMIPLLRAQVPEGSHPMHYANAAWDFYKAGKPTDSVAA